MTEPLIEGQSNWDLQALHRKSLDNRAALSKSERAGCFQCLKTFEPARITRWVQARRDRDLEHDCALCPFCSTDAVLASSDVELSHELLLAMHRRWFVERIDWPNTTINCQMCGLRVPASGWPRHVARHHSGDLPILPAVEAFFRHGARPAEPPGVPVRLWVTELAPLGHERLETLPTFFTPFEYQGQTYQLQSMELGGDKDMTVDIVLSRSAASPRPRLLTPSELEAARLVPREHSCGSSCLRCWALRTGQLGP